MASEAFDGDKNVGLMGTTLLETHRFDPICLLHMENVAIFLIFYFLFFLFEIFPPLTKLNIRAKNVKPNNLNKLVTYERFKFVLTLLTLFRCGIDSQLISSWKVIARRSPSQDTLWKSSL